MTELFPSSFLEGIRHLRILARRVPHGRDAGEHASRFGGSGLDFRDFRPYAPGDDLRRVDWNAYRRNRRLLTRLFEEPRRVHVHLLLDVSDSTFFEDPPRANAGRRFAAALTAAAVEQHDSVTIYPYGARLERSIRVRGSGELPLILEQLKALQPSGMTDTPAALRQFAAQRPRPGLVVLVSDFFDPAGLDATFGELARLRHRVLLAQLMRQGDRVPDWRGDVELVDCETGAEVRVALNDDALRDYAQRYVAWEDRLRALAAQRQAPLLSIDADAPIVPQLEQLFTGGTLRL